MDKITMEELKEILNDEENIGTIYTVDLNNEVQENER